MPLLIRLHFLSSLLLVSSLALARAPMLTSDQAETRISRHENSILVSLSSTVANIEETNETEFLPTRTFLLPGLHHQPIPVEVLSTLSEPLSSELSNLLDRLYPTGQPFAELDRAVQLRDFEGTQYKFVPFVRVGAVWREVEQFRLDLPGGMDNGLRGRSIAPSFAPIYAELLGLDSLDELGIPVESGGYLVVGNPEYLEAIEEWTDWKRRCGVRIDTLQTGTSTTFAVVKSRIQARFNNADVPPEYLLIVADPVWGNRIPGSYYPSQPYGPIVTDHPYSLLAGDDYFPDIWVGRWSIRSPLEARTIARKSIAYEQGTYLANDPDWVQRGLVVCDATYSSTGLTSSWIRREMLRFGFSQVDSVWAPDITTPGPQAAVMNDGVGWVSYRGFGSPSGWVQPVFDVQDALGLQNAGRTPIVTGTVCGVGRFDDETDPCLGEAFLRAGTPTIPIGGVAFVGPSEIDTHTRWNNCMSTGIYTGLLREGMTTLGPIIFRGKQNIWNGFPNNHEPGNSESSALFYFHTYNILGDPGLLVRSRTAEPLTLDYPESLTTGANDLPVSVSDSEGTPVEGAHIAVSGASWGPLSLVSDRDGTVRFDFSEQLPPVGELVLTATMYNAIPAIDTLLVGDAPLAVRLDSLTISGPVHPGAELTLTPYIGNSGTGAQEGFTATLTSLDSRADILGGTNSYTSLGSPGEQANPVQSFAVEVPVNAQDGRELGLLLSLEFANGTRSLRLPLTVEAPSLELTEDVFVTDGPGTNATGVVQLVNNGSLASIESDFEIVLPEGAPLTAVRRITTLPALQPGEDGLLATPLSISIGDEAFTGDRWSIGWRASDPSGRVERGTFTLVAGVAGPGDPSLPDAYGYRAYDDSDYGTYGRPAFDWFEIDARRGGPGSQVYLPDYGDEQDRVTWRYLPFDVQYFGETYSQISICSNGWIAFGHTEDVNFRNWNLPSGPGPTNILAPFWDDLYLDRGRVSAYHNEEEGVFIIQWSDARLPYGLDDSQAQNFQVLIYDQEHYPTETGDNEIAFQYAEIHDLDASENFATVGLRNSDGSSGLQLSYARRQNPSEPPLHSGMAYRITTATRGVGRDIRLEQTDVYDNGEFGSEGNGDGLIDAGERVMLNLRVRNVGTETAEHFRIRLAETDDAVSLGTQLVGFNHVEPGEVASALAMVPLEIASDAEDGHYFRLSMSFEVTGNEPLRQTGAAYLIHAPRIRLSGMNITEEAGDGDGNYEAGETFIIDAVLSNAGSGSVADLDVQLEASDPFVEILAGSGSISDFPAGTSRTITGFRVHIDNQCPDLRIIQIPIRLDQDGRLVARDTLFFQIGDYPLLDSFEGFATDNWTFSDNFWHRTDDRSISGAHSLHWGHEDFQGYPSIQATHMTSEPFDLIGTGELDLFAFVDLSFTARTSVKLLYADGDSARLVYHAGPTQGWERWTFPITNHRQDPSTRVRISLYPHFWDNGTGFYIDDIIVRTAETGIDEATISNLPDSFALHPIRPNPFNPSTIIQVDLPTAARLELKLYNLLGQEVKRLYSGPAPAGVKRIMLDADGLSSGVYFLHASIPGKLDSRQKVVLLK
ncbi:T9SS type A sorting domain-containing protein [bacterium]|nr:T9SS type A sorting domain-containing protein [bacterium]